MALEDIVMCLATRAHVFQNETRESIKNIEQQMSHLIPFVDRLESQGELLGQTEKKRSTM